MREYGKYMRLTSMVMFGGVNINPQIERLRRGVDILVATPGRLLDHAQQRTVDLSRVEILVLDEADRMLDMGFIRDIKRVLALLPKVRQNLLFSATFSAEIKALADGLLNRPAMIEVAFRTATADLIKQRVIKVDRERKRELLAHLILQHRWFQVLVFTRTKHGANKLAEQLNKQGIARARHPRQQEPGRAHPGARRIQGRHACRCWSRPTSPRAGSTSPTCRTSSTSNCRTSPRTTSIASAAPAAPARKARPFRSCASTSRSFSPTSKS